MVAEHESGLIREKGIARDADGEAADVLDVAHEDGKPHGEDLGLELDNGAEEEPQRATHGDDGADYKVDDEPAIDGDDCGVDEDERHHDDVKEELGW